MKTPLIDEPASPARLLHHRPKLLGRLPDRRCPPACIGLTLRGCHVHDHFVIDQGMQDIIVCQALSAEEDQHIFSSDAMHADHATDGVDDLGSEVADGGEICISFADVAGSPIQGLIVHVADPVFVCPSRGGPTFYEHRVDVGILLCEPL